MQQGSTHGQVPLNISAVILLILSIYISFFIIDGPAKSPVTTKVESPIIDYSMFKFFMGEGSGLRYGHYPWCFGFAPDLVDNANNTKPILAKSANKKLNIE